MCKITRLLTSLFSILYFFCCSAYTAFSSLSGQKPDICGQIYSSLNFTGNDDTDFFFFNMGGSPCNIGLCCIARRNNDLFIFDAGRTNQHFDYVFPPPSDEEAADGQQAGLFSQVFNSVGTLGKTSLDILDKITDGTTLKLIIVTHPHADHFNFIKPLLDHIKSKAGTTIGGVKVVIGGSDTTIAKRTICVHKIKEALGVEPSTFYVWQKGTGEEDLMDLFSSDLASFQALGVQFIVPNRNPNTNDVNDSSLIFGFNGMLFTGDATQQTMNSYFPGGKPTGNVIISRARGFVLTHHGADTNGSPQVVWEILAVHQSGIPLVGIIPAGASDATHPAEYIREVVDSWPSIVRDSFPHPLNYRGRALLWQTDRGVFETDYPDDWPLTWIKFDATNVYWMDFR